MTCIEAERRARGWTQTELAFHAGVTQGEVSRFERRQAVPRPRQAERLARVLGLPVDRLLGEVREPAEPAADVAEASDRG